jgi:hypothetical protein
MHAFTELRESKKTDASSCISVCLLFSLSLSLFTRAVRSFALRVRVTALSLSRQRKRKSERRKKREKKKAEEKNGPLLAEKIFLFCVPTSFFFLSSSSPPPEKGKKGKIDDDDDEEEEEEKVASLHFSEREREKERERERKRREEKPKVAERFVSARVERRVVWKYFYERTECSVRRLSRGTDRKSEKAKRVPSLPPLLSTTR